MARELAREGLRATFFLEMFAATLFGEGSLRAVADPLLDHGQDIQMHLHPVFWRHAQRSAGQPYPEPSGGRSPDAMSAYEEDEQVQLIEQGTDLFRRIVGRRPAAFRAGGYMANAATLRALAKRGIFLDSSANPAAGWFPRDDGERINRARRLQGVWELPVTVVRTHLPDTTFLKHLEISALSFGELKRALTQAQRAGLRHAVLVFHSFSTVKSRDVTYSRFRPDRIVIGRFRKLLRFLSERSDLFRVRTLGELSEAGGPMNDDGPGFLPDLGRIRPLLRKVVQAGNRCYWV